MVLYLIGLGLGSTEELTLSGLSLMKCCSKFYLHLSKYIQIGDHMINYLEKELCKCLLIEKTFTERIHQIVLESQDENVAVLMPGNPFCDDLYPQIKCHCLRHDVSIKIVQNMSYINALGNTGIQLYKFGKSIFIDSCSKEPLDSHFATINSNLKEKMNTLVLFDRSDNETALSAEFLAAIGKLENEDMVLGPESKVVLVFKQNDRWLFEYGSVSSFKNMTSAIEALAVCSEFDCVEEEYLREMKNFQYTERQGKGNFNIIGLGLGKPEDITLKGRSLIEKSHKVFLEGYTSIMRGGKDDLESFFGKKIVVADRDMVEQNSDEILRHLETSDVAFLVVGDPFGATTHTDIILRSVVKAKDIVIANNASIMNAVGISCLKPSNFGGTISIPFWTDSYKPDSFYDKITANLQLGLHTLCLLDIQVKEQSFENLARGRKIYEKPRYMSVDVAAQQLLESKEKRIREKGVVGVDENTEVVCLLRVGTVDETIMVLPLGELTLTTFGDPLHSLVIIGRLDDDEVNAIC